MTCHHASFETEAMFTKHKAAVNLRPGSTRARASQSTRIATYRTGLSSCSSLVVRHMLLSHLPLRSRLRAHVAPHLSAFIYTYISDARTGRSERSAIATLRARAIGAFARNGRILSALFNTVFYSRAGLTKSGVVSCAQASR